MDFDPAAPVPLWFQFLPLGVLSIAVAVIACLLARDKGRNVVLWTVLGVIPVVNFVCIWFFVGASNLRLERKLDRLLEERLRSRE